MDSLHLQMREEVGCWILSGEMRAKNKPHFEIMTKCCFELFPTEFGSHSDERACIHKKKFVNAFIKITRGESRPDQHPCDSL